MKEQPSEPSEHIQVLIRKQLIDTLTTGEMFSWQGFVISWCFFF